LLKKLLPAAGQFGESWEISGHPLHVSVVAEGALAGTSLADLWQWHAAEIWGRRRPIPQAFPWLIKFLDCEDYLSVQVHPNDTTAARFCPGERGKNEAWVVLHAEPEARLYTGLRSGVDATSLRQALEEGTVERCLHGFRPRRGDCVYLRAGTVHAAGGGVLLAEIQQPSDATLRLFDWNRVGPDGKPRPLHLEAALASVNWGAGSVTPRHDDFIQSQHALLLECPHFQIHRIYLAAGESASLADFRGAMSVWVVIQGQATLRTSHDCYACSLGTTLLLPAACEAEDWRCDGREGATLLGYGPPMPSTSQAS